MLSVFQKSLLALLLFFGNIEAKTEEKKDDFSLRRLLLWPVDHLIQPGFNMALRPIVEPIQYAFDRNVVSRTMDFFSLSSGQKIYLFPTTNVFLKENSYFGIFFLYKDVFGWNSHRTSLHYKAHLDGDWSLKGDYGISEIPGTPWFVKGEYQQSYYRDSKMSSLLDASFAEGENAEEIKVLFADTTYQAAIDVGYAFNPSFSQIFGFGFKNRNMRSPLEMQTEIPDSKALADLLARGMYDKVVEIPFSYTLSYDSRESPFASSFGNLQKVKIFYDYLPNFGDYMGLEGLSQFYFLMGNKPFTLTRKEDRENKKIIKNLNLRNAIDLLTPEEFGKFLFSRKVLVSHFRFRQVWDAEEQPLGLTGLSNLTWDSPLRAYSHRSFLSYGNAGMSFEYRWPIIQRLDGFIFNEYATFFRSPQKMKLDNIYNSWGLGFRIYNPDFFFLRTHMAIHGWSGFAFNVSVSPVY